MEKRQCGRASHPEEPGELQKENEELQAKVASLETQVTDTQLALCDVYEQVIMVAGAGEV